MSSKACDQCGKAFTSVHRTTCFICKPLSGPSREQMLAMHLSNSRAIQRLTAANARVEELEKQYCDLMEAVKNSRGDHGNCKAMYNGEPWACTRCMAIRKLDEMIKNYKGRKVTLA